LPKVPEVFFKPAECLNDPTGNILVPTTAPSALDAEVELAIIIGKDCKNVDQASALDYVLGYTVANDVTARDVQARVTQWGFSKGYDGFCPLGPVIVRADSPGFDVRKLPMKTILNGEVLQDGNTSEMIFSVEEIVSYLSQDTTLIAGTTILTGTPSGIGHSYKPPKYIGPGDDLSVSIGGGLGTLRNGIVAARR
jgi:2-keto-4-pentenoate hydratase/2-oxohepta-3-ene-1,7-dioic acid hydratase in catechol pathway